MQHRHPNHAKCRTSHALCDAEWGNTNMRLLRPSEVADALACSRSTVYALKDKGKLPHCKVGGMVRFRQEDVEQFIADSLVIHNHRPVHSARSPRLKRLHL